MVGAPAKTVEPERWLEEPIVNKRGTLWCTEAGELTICWPDGKTLTEHWSMCIGITKNVSIRIRVATMNIKAIH